MNDCEVPASGRLRRATEADLPRRAFRFTLRSALLAIILFTVLLGVTRHFYLIARHRSVCAINLKLLLLAMHNYEAAFGCFPPAYVADDEGRPMHSWRVLLLPYLGESAIYNAYDFNEPWNGPNNSRLASKIPSVFVCPERRHGGPTTDFLGIFGAETLWQGAVPVKIRQILDGTSNTIALVEVEESDVNWMDPRDYLFGSNPPTSRHRHVGFADGSVRVLTVDAAKFRSECTISGLEPIANPMY